MRRSRHPETMETVPDDEAGNGAGPPLRIAVTGASGLIGTRLQRFLIGRGHLVLPVVRRKQQLGPNEIPWDPATGEIDAPRLEGVDAVVNLAGRSILATRWTSKVKDEIRRSRVEGTRLLSETLASLERPPKVLVSASAIGYYGDRGDEILTEDSPAGEGFLAGVCREWEAATAPAVEAGIRVAILRLGVVLAGEGGSLAKMVTPLKLGLGGPIGDGCQYMSWIALSDLVRAIRHVLGSDLAGPVNITAPEPVTNAELTRALAKVLRRPAWLRVPGWAVRGALGEMGRELLLGSARVLPTALRASGFAFEYPDLEGALHHELGIGSG